MSRMNVSDVISLLSVLADEAELKITVTESLKGGLAVGVLTVIGGLLGGPRGLALGAALGGAGAAYYSSGKFQSVGAILKDMDDVKKKQLFVKACEIFSKFQLEDIDMIRRAITEPDMKRLLLAAVVDHVEGTMQMQIIH